MAHENILLHYLNKIYYQNDPLNVIGATTVTSLRTVPSPSGDVAYVRKFGTDYLIKQVTDITDPVDGNMTFTVKAADGTTLGSRTGGGAFSAGSTLATAQSCYLEISASGGAVTVLASITIDTDVDVGGLKEIIAARFRNAIGLGKSVILNAGKKIKKYMDSKRCELIGLDVMEIDTHLLSRVFPKSGRIDQTVEVIDEFLDFFI